MFTKKSQETDFLINHDLTLLVTLKDRFEFTKRMCRYFSEVQYPFHVIFSDGSLEDDTEKFFKTLKTPGFSYEYIRYPKDENYSQYYKKCASAIEKVKTPYVMLADNDDFPISEGQLKAIEFLKKNPEHVGCNGRVVGIILDSINKPYGKNSFFVPYYCKVMDFPTKLDQKNGTDRIVEYCKDFYSIFYAIFKTESFVTTLEDIEKINFDSLHVHEIFLSSMQLAQGKVHSLDAVTYIRQKGSSQAAASCKGLFFDIFYKNMIPDLRRAFEHIAQFLNKKEKEKIFSDLYKAYYLKINSDYVVIGFYLLKRMLNLFNKRSIYTFFLLQLSKINFPLTAWMSINILRSIAPEKNLVSLKNLTTRKS